MQTPRRVLVVDDEPEIVELVRDVLTAEGSVVDGAADAAAALELVRANIYDIAILDFNLPDMNGIMLHRQIRQMDPELAARTLFTSGLIQTESDLSYYAAQGGGFLPKPFEVSDLLAALAEL